MHRLKFEGNIIDIESRTCFPGEIWVENGIVTDILYNTKTYSSYFLPGFIDAHIHIESSMLTPTEFARTAVRHGTVATVSDPHEIANVCGVKGVQFMIDDSKNAKLKIHFGAPSCVPATNFETAGAIIDSEGVRTLLESEDIFYLSEMMNYPGVLHGDQEVLQKIAHAKLLGKPIDGHAPGLTGDAAIKYISAGISTDHECYTISEAEFKLSHGMKVIIREGSAAKNYYTLHPLIPKYVDLLMFCSDDKHPDDLLRGHINELVTKSLKLGYDLYDILQIACINPIEHYKLKVGRLRVGDRADFIEVQDTESFEVLKTVINGEIVFDGSNVYIPKSEIHPINNFNCKQITTSDIEFPIRYNYSIPVIKALDGELITEKMMWEVPNQVSVLNANIEDDILKICVVNRYQPAKPTVGWIHGFGLKNGAIGSTVAHDSHNIIVVGTNDEDIVSVVSKLIESEGGLACADGTNVEHLPLPIAGLMSDQSCEIVGKQYEKMTQWVQERGGTLKSPFMTLSFMALLVIPKIKMSDLGLFDAEVFKFYA